MEYDLPNFTETGGLETIMQEGVRQVPILMPLILFMIYIVIAGLGYYAQEKRTGAGNLPMWCAISGLITTAGAFMLFLVDNLVNIEVIVICLIVTIISAFWFLVGERD